MDLKQEKTVNNEIISKEKANRSKEFKCVLCEYECDKSTTLWKHINSKHTEQKCKMCSKDFKTSMELVSHVAKEHHEEGEAWDIKYHSTPKSNKEGTHSSFEVDALLDEFL